MPSILEVNDEKDSDLLSLQLDLLKLHTLSDGTSEGWMSYSLKLMRGDNVLFTTDANIHDSEVKALIQFLTTDHDTLKTFQPMEPDFEFSIVRKKRSAIDPDSDEVMITCFIDELASLKGVYGKSWVGIKYISSRERLSSFAQKLDDTRLQRTRGVDLKV